MSHLGIEGNEVELAASWACHAIFLRRVVLRLLARTGGMRETFFLDREPLGNHFDVALRVSNGLWLQPLTQGLLALRSMK